MKQYYDLMIFVVCLFILAVVFNLFFASFAMIISGTSGIAIIFSELLQIPPHLIIIVFHVLVVIFGYWFLSKAIMARALLGLVLYPLFIAITEPVQQYAYAVPANDFLVFMIFGALLMGLMIGIIFKKGYTYGGGGLIIRMINKYYGFSIGTSGFFFNVLIIIFGGFVLGIEKVLYAVLIIYISTYLQDRILLGDYANKLVIINTKKSDIMKVFLASINLKATRLESQGCYKADNTEMIMCYLSNHDYFLLKKGIEKIDPNAFVFATNAFSREEGKL